MSKKWHQGHIDSWWDDSFKSLEYRYTPLTNTEDEIRWLQEGYGYFRNLNGMTYTTKQGMPEYALRFLNIFEGNYHGTSKRRKRLPSW